MRAGGLGPVQTRPEKFENAALFLRLGLPRTLICHENGASRKRSSNRRNLITPALGLMWTETSAFCRDELNHVFLFK